VFVEFVSFRHKGLRTFVERDDARGLKADQVKRVRNIVTALVAAADLDSLEALPGWRLHELKGERAGTWSISVTGNWRLTFRIEAGQLADVDLEDYH
jgi:proteic killer suppression protein